MKYAYIIISIIFILKLLSNLVVPYATLKLEDEEDGMSMGIPLLMDYILLGMLLILSKLSGQDCFPYGVTNTLIWGVSLIVATYIHYFVIMVLGTQLNKINSKRQR